MVVAYHTHEFQIPTASEAEVAAGTESGKVVTPATLGSSTAFATAAQGALADTALQPADVGTAAAAATTDFATAAQGGLADTAVQPATLTAGLATKQPVDASLTTLSGKTIGTKGLDVLAGAAASDVINTLGGAAGQFVNAQLADLDAAKLTGTIDPARIPILPSAKQVVSSGGIADLTAPQQAEIGQGTIVTTTDGRRWVYTGTGSKVLEASYIVLADITPEWDQIANKPALATGAQGTLADSAVQPGDPVSDLAETTTAKIMSGDERIKLGALPDNASLTSALAGRIALTEKGVANGVATLGADSKVPAGQLPSYVDDVLEYADFSTFPVTGEASKIYVALDAGKTYRWSGSAYIEISASPGSTDAVPEGSVNLYFSNDRVDSFNASRSGKGTPVDSDALALIDSQDSGKTKLLSWTRVKDVLKAFFDTVYFSANGGTITGDTVLSRDYHAVFETAATDTFTAYHRFRNSTGFYDIGVNSAGQFFFNNYDNAGVFQNTPFLFDNDGVPVFGVRPTYGGVGLATLSEVGSGGTSGVASFKGRSGTVDPAAGDYSSSQITHGIGSVNSALNDVNNKLSFTSPEALGLIGDGVTDNSAAWTAAMAALPSRGIVIVWPAQQYYFASTIEANKAVYHIGAPNTASSTSYGTEWLFSAAASLLINKQIGGKYAGIRMRKLAQGTTLLEWKASTVSGESGSSYVTFEECLISGECTVATVYLTNCLLIIFKNCRFFNSYKGAACKVVWLDGSHFGVSGDVRTGDNVDNIEFLTCVATGAAKVSTSDYAVRIDGFYLDGKCDSTKFFQCKALWCYYGVILTNSGATVQVPNFTRFAQGGMENNYKNAIYCHKGDITTFSDMYASLDSDVDSSTIYGNTDVVLVDSAYTGSVEFTACMMRGGKRDAYRLEGGRVQINGGQAANSGLRTTGYSVDILSSVVKVILQGLDCTTMATGSTGITTAVRNLKGASGIIINGCDLSGYSTAISGTATGAGIAGNLT